MDCLRGLVSWMGFWGEAGYGYGEKKLTEHAWNGSESNRKTTVSNRKTSLIEQLRGSELAQYLSFLAVSIPPHIDQAKQTTPSPSPCSINDTEGSPDPSSQRRHKRAVSHLHDSQTSC